MARKIISTYTKRKRTSHPHSKNASRLKTSKQYINKMEIDDVIKLLRQKVK